MSEVAAGGLAAEQDAGNPKLALLLAMAMFVLVVDTSLMNVSISAVVHDLKTTVSGVQSAIALEALVSAAFILIGSKVGDLIGRKRAYILGLLGYAVGALAMALAQSLTAIIVFWAVIGGLGASLLLPAMQSLIHGNFEGAMQRKAYALVGAAAAIAAAVGPLLGGFITTFLSWRVGFVLEDVIIVIVLVGIKLVHDVPYTGPRQIDLVGAVLSVLGMGGIVLSILVWQEGGEAVAALMVIGVVALVGLVWWLNRQKRRGRPMLLDPGLFASKLFRFGVSGQTLQQIALGGLMIALPIYLQMVLEYNAMLAGLSMAPLVAADPPDHRGLRAGTPRVPAEQLHAVADHGGAGERGRRRELGGWVVRPVVRAGVRRRDHAGDARDLLQPPVAVERRPRSGRAAAGLASA
jgi:MFS family permease